MPDTILLRSPSGALAAVILSPVVEVSCQDGWSAFLEPGSAASTTRLSPILRLTIVGGSMLSKDSMQPHIQISLENAESLDLETGPTRSDSITPSKPDP